MRSVLQAWGWRLYEVGRAGGPEKFMVRRSEAVWMVEVVCLRLVVTVQGNAYAARVRRRVAGE